VRWFAEWQRSFHDVFGRRRRDRLAPASGGAYIRRELLAGGHEWSQLALHSSSGAALADDWKDYENPNYSFTIHFPVDPTVETATYQAAYGRLIPAQR
jgi:hypothetical protein